jgi:hypothetical protein
LKLRFRLLQDFPGLLPENCQLPEGYTLELTSDHDRCHYCAGRLRRVRTSTHYPVGMLLGRPRVRLIHQQCLLCGRADSLEVYYQQVPPGGNYAYDLMVKVGLARFVDQRQDAEIQADLKREWGLSLPASSIGLLSHSFLDGLAAVHQAHAPALRRKLEEDGGYALHVDGTCEPGTEVLFAAIAEPCGWTLETAKMASENQVEISNLMRRCLDRFGEPLAVMRDLSPNIQQAKREAIPQARDLICHYHFLENVGEKLCEQPHAKLTNVLRRLKVRPALGSLRKDLVRWSRKGVALSKSQIDQLLSHPEEIVGFDLVTLRRFVAYVLLRWLDDYTADLQGEYFPFDLPSLAFYRRALQLGKMVSELVAAPNFPSKEFSTLNTIARHLASLREDPEAVAAAERLEKASALFEELRKELRLSSLPGEPLLRGRGPTESRETVEQTQNGLEAWRDRLRQRQEQEPDGHKRADQAIVLKYLQKYEHELVGHVIERKGHEPLVVQRTNNPVEHRFSATKRGVRQKVGAKKLTRQVQALRAEALLVWNLDDPDYVNLVLNGSQANLSSAIAKNWHLAQTIRQQRLAPATNHPLPTTKKQIRNSKVLDNIKKIVTKIVAAVLGKTCAD